MTVTTTSSSIPTRTMSRFIAPPLGSVANRARTCLSPADDARTTTQATMTVNAGGPARPEGARRWSAETHAQDADRMGREVVLDGGAGDLDPTRVDADRIGLREGVHGVDVRAVHFR